MQGYNQNAEGLALQMSGSFVAKWSSSLFSDYSGKIVITPCKQVMDTGWEMLWKVAGSTMQEGVGETGTPSKYSPTASIPSMQTKPSKTKVTWETKGEVSRISPEPSLSFLSVAPSQSLQRRQHRGEFQSQVPKKI